MIWIVTSITGSIIGSATSKWFDKTKLGRWFNKKVYNSYNWAAKRYGLKIIKAEDKWKLKYPNIAAKMEKLEKDLQKCKEWSHPPVGLMEFDDYEKLDLRIKNIETHIEGEVKNGRSNAKDNAS